MQPGLQGREGLARGSLRRVSDEQIIFQSSLTRRSYQVGLLPGVETPGYIQPALRVGELSRVYLWGKVISKAAS